MFDYVIDHAGGRGLRISKPGQWRRHVLSSLSSGGYSTLAGEATPRDRQHRAVLAFPMSKHDQAWRKSVASTKPNRLRVDLGHGDEGVTIQETPAGYDR